MIQTRKERKTASYQLFMTINFLISNFTHKYGFLANLANLQFNRKTSHKVPFEIRKNEPDTLEGDNLDHSASNLIISLVESGSSPKT